MMMDQETIALIGLLVVIPFCKICSRVGWHWAWGLVAVIPLGSIVLIVLLALRPWPAAARAKRLDGDG